MGNIAPFNSSCNNIGLGGLMPNEDSLMRISVSKNNVFDRACLNGDSLVGIDVLGKVYHYSFKDVSLMWSVQSLSHNWGGGLYLDESFIITPAEIIDVVSGSVIFNLFDECKYLEDLTCSRISEFGLLFQHERTVLRTSIDKLGARLVVFGLDDFSLEVKKIPFVPYCYSSIDGSLFGLDEGGHIVKLILDTGDVLQIGTFDFKPMFLNVGACSDVIVAINSVEGLVALFEGDKQVWKKCSKDFLKNGRHISSAVAIDDGSVIVSVDDGYAYCVVALDIRTGELIWKNDCGDGGGFFVFGENVYTAKDDGKPIVLDKGTGAIKWSSGLLVPTNKVIVSRDYVVYLDATFNASVFQFK